LVFSDLRKIMTFSVLEICAGAGGQALGLENAGFRTSAVVDIDRDSCSTLRANRPSWTVIETDLKEFSGTQYRGIDLLAGGVPCPPFSMGGKQLGAEDERDLFPDALRLVRRLNPKGVLLENVRGLSMPRFESYRNQLITQLIDLGYRPWWQLVYSNQFGLPQLRPRYVLVALKKRYGKYFLFPESNGIDTSPTVGEHIYDLMSANGWKGAKRWKAKASGVGPTIVGGSKKHGGADLGPTRAKEKWKMLGVDGKGIVDDAPKKGDPVDFLPRLTNRMVARLQGFPDDWVFCGGKTSQYRQIGNAFPPPVAKEIGVAIRHAFEKREVKQQSGDQVEVSFR
jgi:DNA (cytosine-5)-methyltransferase 1